MLHVCGMSSRPFAAFAIVCVAVTSICAVGQAAEGSPDSFFSGRQLVTAVRAVALQADGKVLIGGLFSNVDGASLRALARLNVDGTIDGSFKPNISGTNVSVETIVVQTDGKIVVGGVFASIDGVPRANVARLNLDGSLDTGFGQGQAGANGKVSSIVLQPDGKILVGGSFISMNGTARGRIARLGTDGSLDEQFSAGLNGAAGAVADVALQRDGRVVIAGFFNKVNDVKATRIARLTSDGSLDGSIGADGADGTVLGLSLQGDGKIVLVGDFANVLGSPRKRLARLNADGTLDAGFRPSANLEVSTVLAQRDGKILAGGKFTEIDAVVRKGVARLDATGQLDRSFAEGAGANAYVSALAQQPDGKIVVVGDFTSIDGVPRQRVARLEAAIPRDVTPPVIVLSGDNPMQVAFGSVFSDPGARVIDNSDPERSISGSGEVNTSIPGSYSRIYTAVDAAGNSALPVVRTVVVSAAPPPADTEAPVIKLLGDNPMTVMRDSSFTDPGAIVADNTDDDRAILGSNSVDVSEPGAYTVVYAASDTRGNQAAPVMRQVYVTGITRLSTAQSEVSLKSGKRRKLTILASNNSTKDEEMALQFEFAGDAGLITVAAQNPVIVPGKKRATSPPKMKRIPLTISSAAGGKGQVTVTIRYSGYSSATTITLN